MIRIIYDLKLGTGEDFYLVSKNERSELDFEEADKEQEDEEYNYLMHLSQEELADYMLNSLLFDEALCDTIALYFSDNLLRDDSFADKVDILDVSNIRVRRIYKKAEDNSSMKAADVMKVLDITRQTLCRYVKNGKILIDSKINGQYRYNRNSVLALLNKI